jgi:formyl-CoA transferase
MSVTGTRDGDVVKVGVPLADLSAGMYAAVSICAALHHRDVSGRGEYIDIALMDSVMSLLVWEASQLWAFGTTPGPVGTGHRNRTPYQAFEASDGPFIVGAGNESTWKALCRALGREDLAKDPRFLTNAVRMQNEQALVAELSSIFAKDKGQHWVDILTEAGCPAGRILNVAESFSSEHALARGMKIEMDNPSGGVMNGIGFPYKLADSPARVRRRPPRLGEHTIEILQEVAGLSADRVAELLADGVVA